MLPLYLFILSNFAPYICIYTLMLLYHYCYTYVIDGVMLEIQIFLQKLLQVSNVMSGY